MKSEKSAKSGKKGKSDKDRKSAKSAKSAKGKKADKAKKAKKPAKGSQKAGKKAKKNNKKGNRKDARKGKGHKAKKTLDQPVAAPGGVDSVTTATPINAPEPGVVSDFDDHLNRSLDDVIGLLEQEIERLKVSLETYRLSNHPERIKIVRWHVRTIDERQDTLEDLRSLIMAERQGKALH